ncbi:MAG TPA: cytochrome P450 [Candidatus Limnocylindria bacterium]|nr:cytochrome P450 [Candidatus Limnocylindria bacterium]
MTPGRRLPPMLEGGLPWLGHALMLRRDPVGLLRRGRDRFGDVFSIRLAGTRVTAFLGPRAQAAFFQAPDTQLSARDVYRFTTPIFGRGVVYDTTPQTMDEQMGFLYPGLRDERLRAYTQAMQEEVEAYVASWGEEGEIDLAAAMNELTVFVASRCLVGEEFRRALTPELAHLFHDLEGGINLLGFVNPWLPLVPAFRRRDRARARLGQMIAAVLTERRARGGRGGDFLDTLTDARYADGRSLSDEEMVGLLVATIFAGQHTSAVMATWTAVLLLEHPAYLARVLDEQQEHAAGGAIALETLRRLVVLERAIKEAERMHPPLVMLMRRIMDDFECGDVVAPAGGLAMVSPAAGHRLSEVFAEPDRYDPDRFAAGREEDRRSRHALIGFGGGHHRCIGSAFAQQQIKVIWTVILREFDLSLATTEHRPDYATFVVGPRPPCRLRYRRRQRARLVAPAAGIGQPA